MKNAVRQVIDFHKKFNTRIGEKPELPAGDFVIPTISFEGSEKLPKSERQLRICLIAEEVEELFKAESDNDIIEVADALADIVYIVVGTAVAYGIPLHRVFEEVHRSNMTKDGYNETPYITKIGKGPSFKAPDIKKAIFDQTQLPLDPEDEIEALRERIHELQVQLDFLTEVQSEMDDLTSLCSEVASRTLDVIDRCSRCVEERALLGPSWICQECSDLKKDLKTFG